MQRTSRTQHIFSWSRYIMSVAALLSCAWLANGQAIKATVVSAPIESTSVSQWPRELGYKKTELYPLVLTNLGCPLIEVEVAGTKIGLMLDTGTSRGLLLTNHAPEIRYRDPEFSEGLALVDRPGKFKIFRKAVPVELGGRRFVLDELREDKIRRGAGFDHPIALTLGSDILSRFVITIDLRIKKMILALSS